MYMRLVRFALQDGKQSLAKEIAADLIPAIKSQPGCESAVFFGGEGDGECGLAVLWDTEEHANAAAAMISPRLEQHLAGNLKAPPDRRLFPVLQR
jgi:hypothetical protein